MKNSENGKLAQGVGLGIAVAAAAAAGYFFFYGKAGDKNRKKLKGWSLKLKADVVSHLERLKDVNESVFYDTIDKVAKRYSTLKDVDGAELSGLVKDLKGHWKSLKKDLKLESNAPSARSAKSGSRRKK